MQIIRVLQIQNRHGMPVAGLISAKGSMSHLDGIQSSDQNRNGGFGRGFMKKIASSVKCMRVLNPLQLFKNRTESQTQSVVQSDVSSTSVVSVKPRLNESMVSGKLMTNRVQRTPNPIDSAVSIPKVVHFKTAGLTKDLYRSRLEKSLQNKLKLLGDANDGGEKIPFIAAFGFVQASAEEKIMTLANYLAKSKEGYGVENQNKMESELFGATIMLHDKRELREALEQWRNKCVNNQKLGLDNPIYFGLLDKLCLKAAKFEFETAEASIQSTDRPLDKNSLSASADRSVRVKDLIKKFDLKSEANLHEAKSVGAADLTPLSQKLHKKSDSEVEITLDNTDDISLLDDFGKVGASLEKFEQFEL